MDILGIILVYALMIVVGFFGLWQWRSRKSDPVEKGFGFMYVGLSVLFLFIFSIGVLTGNV